VVDSLENHVNAFSLCQFILSSLSAEGLSERGFYRQRIM